MTTDLPTHDYQSAVNKLEAIVRAFDTAAPDMVRSNIMQILGEELNIWPEGVLRAAEMSPPRLVA